MKHRHIADGSTALHFFIGLGAGAAGIDPKMALLVALLAEGTYEVIRAQSSDVLFERDDGSSKANEIMNLLAIVFGAHLGVLGKEQWAKQHPPPATSTPTPTPEVAAGLGLDVRRWYF